MANPQPGWFAHAGVGPDIPHDLVAGDTITFELAPGVIIERHTNDVWAEVSLTSPHVHTGAPAAYRLNCVEFSGNTESYFKVERAV